MQNLMRNAKWAGLSVLSAYRDRLSVSNPNHIHDWGVERALKIPAATVVASIKDVDRVHCLV